jgi:hypothetical protein
MKILVTGAALLASGGAMWLGQDQFLSNHRDRDRPIEQQGLSVEGQVATIGVVDAAALAGLSAETACLAGLSSPQTAACLAAIDASEHRATLAASSIALDEAFAELQRLDRVVSGGGGTQEALNERAAAVAAMASAENNRAEAIAGLKQAIAATAAGDPATLLARIDTNARWRVTPHYKVFDATAAEWTVIERAFRGYEAAVAQEESPDQESVALLQAIEGDANVVAARQRLENDLATIRAVFDAVE